jgi:hypothetical protein
MGGFGGSGRCGEGEKISFPGNRTSAIHPVAHHKASELLRIQIKANNKIIILLNYIIAVIPTMFL